MIREARERAGLSMAQLAAMVGVGEHIIMQAENYLHWRPPYALDGHVDAVAGVIGIDSDTLRRWLDIQHRRHIAAAELGRQAVVTELQSVIELAQRVLRCDDAATLQRIREVLDEMDSAG